MAEAKSEGTKKRATKAKGEGEAAARPARGGLAQKVKPDAQLAAVVGAGDATRAEITKKIWEYVKEKGLQDAQDKRMIHADDKLKPVFGGKEKVTMFEMTKLVNQHVSS